MHGIGFHCRGCCRTFASASAFDAHQDQAAVTVCHDPVIRGMTEGVRQGVTMWGLGELGWDAREQARGQALAAERAKRRGSVA